MVNKNGENTRMKIMKKKKKNTRFETKIRFSNLPLLCDYIQQQINQRIRKIKFALQSTKVSVEAMNKSMIIFKK